MNTPEETRNDRQQPAGAQHVRKAITRATAATSALLRRERGAATAEYAIVIMAAVGFAGLLVVIMRSEEVRAILTNLVQTALTSGG